MTKKKNQGKSQLSPEAVADLHKKFSSYKLRRKDKKVINYR